MAKKTKEPSSNERLTTQQLIDVVLTTPTCCSHRRYELKRQSFQYWIETHKHLSDEEIISRLKKML